MDNKPFVGQLFEMGKYSPFGHRMRFGRDISVNASNDLLRDCGSAPHGFKDLLFTLKSVVDVLVKLGVRVRNRRTVASKDDA